ncbi:Holliday junction resolvase RuvX [Mesorhizobium sp. Z1-4]|uniref:Holliday junction resolvase RuvX n=1 Tax=Mesorhizobium sp. Z1-4 TaxID=2448478 RepID=UPI000FD75BED|nr:Holliday junction resolvase RuvX [Mesorhizobium sp. Z1-4]
MAVTSIEQLAESVQPGQRLAGLDLGTKTIGVAVSDGALSLAHPRTVIRRKKFGADAAQLIETFARENVAAIILGLPVNMDGSEGPRAQASRAFARNLGPLTPLPIVLWDERLSTVAAERSLIGLDVSRARRSAIIDAEAAAFILQGALDRLRILSSNGPK